MSTLINPSAGGGSSLPAGNVGDVLVQTATGPAFVDPILPPTALWYLKDAGLESAIYVSGTAGTGSGVSITTPQPDLPFAMTLSTGTTATGRASRGAQMGGSSIALGAASGRITYKCMGWQMPALSTAADTAVVRFGLTDNSVAGPATDGVYFEYDASTSVNLLCVTAAGAVRTSTDGATPFVPVAGVTYDFRIVVTNDASASFYYRARYASAWTLITTTTTNIPTGTTRAIGGAGAGITKSVGLTPVTVIVQLQIVYQEAA